MDRSSAVLALDTVLDELETLKRHLERVAGGTGTVGTRPAGSVRPYLVHWSNRGPGPAFRMHAHRQVTEHRELIFAYDAADALVQARQRIREDGDMDGPQGRSTIDFIQPPITEDEEKFVATAAVALPRTGGDGYEEEIK